MEKPSKKQLFLVFGFFICMALSWFTFSVYGDVKAVQSLFWPSIEGSVISGSVETSHGSKGASKSKPVIHYSFSVNGVEYKSNRYSSTVARGSSFWAKEVIDRHPAGSAITVYYNPDDPSNSMLDPGFQKDDVWMTFLSLSISILLIYGLIRQLKVLNSKGCQ